MHVWDSGKILITFVLKTDFFPIIGFGVSVKVLKLLVQIKIFDQLMSRHDQKYNISVHTYGYKCVLWDSYGGIKPLLCGEIKAWFWI